MLVFCIIYCSDNIYDISLFGKFLPSNDIIKALSRHILSGFNRLDFLYNIHVSYWTPGEYPHTLGTPPKCMRSSSLGRWNGPWWSEDDIGGGVQEACTAYIYNVDFLEMELILYCILPAICPYMGGCCLWNMIQSEVLFNIQGSDLRIIFQLQMYKQYKCTVNVPHKQQYTRPRVFNDEIQWYTHTYLQSRLSSTAQLHMFEGGVSSVPPIPAGIWSFWWILVEWNLAEGPASFFILVFSILVDYESSDVWRDSFIIPWIEEFFSALMQNLDFFPWKLMARFPAQSGSQLVLGSKLNGILLKLFHA